MNERRLIVSGDDFGLHVAMNEGVIAAHRKGIVTSASVVPCGEAFEDACRLARANPSLDIGVHLTLVEERPLCSDLPTLAPRGSFPSSYAALFTRFALGRIRRGEIESELEAQLRRALDAGLVVTHLDSHQHTHFFPGIAEIVIALARRHKIHAIRGAARVIPSRTKFSLLLAPFARRAQRLAAEKGIATTDTLLLPSPSGRVRTPDLLNALDTLTPGTTELVVHPGSSQQALAARYAKWNFRWEEELEAACAAAVRERATNRSVRFSRFSDL